MVNEGIRAVVTETNPAKLGIIIASVIIFSSLLPNITIGNFKLIFPDFMFTLFMGITLLAFSMSMKVNMAESYDGRHIVTTIPVSQSPLSKKIQGIAIFFLVLSILRAIVLLIYH